MKASKLISIAVISAATLLFATAGNTSAYAANGDTLKGDATIKYKEDDSVNTTTDPEKPGEKGEGGDGNVQTETGTLTVDYVSKLKFGTQNITTNKGVYYAAPDTFQAYEVDADGNVKEDANGDPIKVGAAEDRGNFVQVTDKRADGAPKGWKLTAALTKPFTIEGGTDHLNGATIDYLNPFVNSTQDPSVFPTAAVFKLENDGTTYNTADVATAAAGQGWGQYTIEYGRPSNDDIAKSIRLTVPANTPLQKDKEYKAEITWTIAAI